MCLALRLFDTLRLFDRLEYALQNIASAETASGTKSDISNITIKYFHYDKCYNPYCAKRMLFL